MVVAATVAVDMAATVDSVVVRLAAVAAGSAVVAQPVVAADTANSGGLTITHSCFGQPPPRRVRVSVTPE
jgi:hypothetical protein